MCLLESFESFFQVSIIPSFRSVNKFVDDFKKKNLPLHMLFNNAGEWIREDDTYTEDGFQVRHLVPPSTNSPCFAL